MSAMLFSNRILYQSEEIVLLRGSTQLVGIFLLIRSCILCKKSKWIEINPKTSK